MNMSSRTRAASSNGASEDVTFFHPSVNRPHQSAIRPNMPSAIGNHLSTSLTIPLSIASMAPTMPPRSPPFPNLMTSPRILNIRRRKITVISSRDPFTSPRKASPRSAKSVRIMVKAALKRLTSVPETASRCPSTPAISDMRPDRIAARTCSTEVIPRLESAFHVFSPNSPMPLKDFAISEVFALGSVRIPTISPIHFAADSSG